MLCTVLASLIGADAELVIAVAVLGELQNEAAARLAVSADAARKRYQRAVARLRDTRARAHGGHRSVCARQRQRSLQPAEQLRGGGASGRGPGNILFDLLTEDEAADRRNVFDIELLGQRLALAAGLGRTAGGREELADRLLRRQHRRGGGAARRGAAAKRGSCNCVAWRPSRHGRPGARPSAGADPADRRRTRHWSWS